MINVSPVRRFGQSIRLAVFYLLLPCLCWSQEASLSIVRELSGNGSAIVVGGKSYIDAKAKLGPSVGVLSLPEHTWEYLRFSKNGQAFEAKPIEAGKYLFTEPGNYWVIVALGFSEGKQYSKEFTFTIGDNPDPPPDPGPDPPKPTPDVPNEYNLGKVAYELAPSDKLMAVQIAGWYRQAANYGYGIPILKPIDAAMADLDQKFAAKQCRDVETCQKWGQWKAAINAALRAEQTKRGTFKREDWYKALNEIAAGLEAVK